MLALTLALQLSQPWDLDLISGGIGLPEVSQEIQGRHPCKGGCYMEFRPDQRWA